jgi:hypothetical protein
MATPPVRAPWCRLVFGLVLVLLLAAVGCGPPKVKQGVQGKVTLDGKPVNGEVTFLASDGKPYSSPISPEGNYSIPGCPKGEAKIKVTGGLVAPGASSTVGPDGKPLPSLDPGGGAKAPEGPKGVAPPAKYGDYGTSGLKCDVLGTPDQVHDITLTP